MFPDHYARVRILPEEWPFIQRIGEKRQRNVEAKGYKNKADTSMKNKNIDGFASEFASALYYMPWVHTKLPDDLSSERFDGFWVKPNFSDMQCADVGTMIEVKSSDYREKQLWNLVVNSDQLRDDRAYVNCLTAWLPDYVLIQGWAWGSEIREKGRPGKNHIMGHPILIYSHELLHAPVKLFDQLREA